MWFGRRRGLNSKGLTRRLPTSSRRDCLEVRGIPIQDQKEDTDAIIRKVGSLIGENEISISHRLPSSRSLEGSGNQRSPAIIVKFVRRDVRDSFYKARSGLRNKSTKDLGIKRIAERKIFIAESFTQKNKCLFNKCLGAKRDLNYKFL